MNTQWYDITQIKPPEGLRVIGILLYKDNDDTGVINGSLYDMRSNALIDRRRGRWMTISHWAYVPSIEPKQEELAGCEYCQGAPDECRYCG